MHAEGAGATRIRLRMFLVRRWQFRYAARRVSQPAGDQTSLNSFPKRVIPEPRNLQRRIREEVTMIPGDGKVNVCNVAFTRKENVHLDLLRSHTQYGYITYHPWVSE